MKSWSEKEVRTLIRSSAALKEDPAEQSFWLEHLNKLAGADMSRIGEILSEEALARAAVEESLTRKTLEINAAYIDELKKVRPRLLKDIEEASRKSEAAESILNELPDA